MNNRSRTPMLLTELALMLLIFSLCAAVCLNLFFSARETARASADLSRAASWAQSAAEAYKAAGGEAARAAELLGAQASGGGFSLRFDDAWGQIETDSQTFTLTLTETGGHAAHVEVTAADDTLFSLSVKAVAYG